MRRGGGHASGSMPSCWAEPLSTLTTTTSGGGAMGPRNANSALSPTSSSSRTPMLVGRSNMPSAPTKRPSRMLLRSLTSADCTGTARAIVMAAGSDLTGPGLAADAQVLQRDARLAHRDGQPLQLRPPDAIRLLVEERQQQRVARDE